MERNVTYSWFEPPADVRTACGADGHRPRVVGKPAPLVGRRPDRARAGYVSKALDLEDHPCRVHEDVDVAARNLDA